VTFALNRNAVVTIEAHDGSRRDVTVVFPQASDPGHGQAQGTPPLVRPRAVSASRLDTETGYLRVGFFPGPSGREFANALRQAFAQLGPCKRLLIDLRGNNGGFVGYLRLASYLTPGRLPVGYSLTREGQEAGLTRESVKKLRRIPDGRLGEIWMFMRFQMRAKDRRNRSVSLWTEGLGAQPFHGRIVMLVNEHTFSAAETVAAFASEEHLATLVGTKTAGQTNGGGNHRIADRFTLRLPQTVWHTWRETSYEGIGITPDVVVEQSDADLRSGVDTQLNQAREVLRDK
jgi:carboxyl-terminal processing protease